MCDCVFFNIYVCVKSEILVTIKPDRLTLAKIILRFENERIVSWVFGGRNLRKG